MDIEDYNGIRCFKCDESVLHNLNIIYNSSNTTVVLWNKFQIFVYDNLEFQSAAKIITPEFKIQCLLSSSNYVICLDSEGNVQVTSLKLKSQSQKRFKTCFQMREQGVIAILPFSEDFTLSLKCELNSYFLILNRRNTEFQYVKKISLICNQDWDATITKGNYIFNSHLINDEHIESVKKAMNIEENAQSEWYFLLMSFDKRVIYTCLYHPKMSVDHITLVKLYTCPSKICSIDVIDGVNMSVVIGLTIGTLIRLSFEDLTKEPDIVHLNSAVHKILPYNNTAIYTDGITTWKAEDLFSNNIKFTKLFVTQVNDMLKFGDQIICTTFSNLVYTFQIDDENSYKKQQTTEEYCCVEKLTDNMSYLQRIMEEVVKNIKVMTKLSIEGNYITALSLSNRQDILDNVINCSVTVYEDYKEAVRENGEAKLTEDISKYHNKDTYLLLVNIKTVVEERYDDVLCNTSDDVKIHITISIETKILKTTSIRITEKLMKLCLLIPFNPKNMELTQINVNIRLVLSIPGVFEAKQTSWTVLYRKHIKLLSEQFIKTKITSKNISLKETCESLGTHTKLVASNLYGNLFEFDEVPKTQTPNWPLYVKLSNNYTTMLNSKEYYERKFNRNRANYLAQQFSKDLLTTNKTTLVVYNEKVDIQIVYDGFSCPLLMITCQNMKIALNIRNFFANVMYNDFVEMEGMELIGSTFYTTVENLQKAIQDTSQDEDLSHLIEQFERHIMGSLTM